MGWGMSLVSDFVNGCLMLETDMKDVPERIMERVKDLSGATYGDDTTCLLLLCREARVLNIVTGPPSKAVKDADAVRRFMEMRGRKVVCGSTTTEIFARHLKTQAVIKDSASADYLKPPSYEIKGIDLATEGAITLNQVYNIIDERADKLDPHSSVSDLYRLLHESDRINFFVGTASNPAHRAISFKQMGVLPREAIILLLAEKLTKMGKLVKLEYL